MESIYKVLEKHSNFLILYCIYEKYTPLSDDGTGFANIKNYRKWR